MDTILEGSGGGLYRGGVKHWRHVKLMMRRTFLESRDVEVKLKNEVLAWQRPYPSIART